MSATLEFLRGAQEDAEEATRYYERRVSGLGVRFRTEVESVCAAILNNPLLWRERSGGYRRVNLPGFPYLRGLLHPGQTHFSHSRGARQSSTRLLEVARISRSAKRMTAGLR